MEGQGPVARASKDALGEVEQLMGANKFTVEVIRCPSIVHEFQGTDDVRQILLPDFGWSYNPGKAGAAPGPATINPEQLEAIVREAKEWTWRSFGLPEQPPKIPTPPRLPRATSRDAAKEQIRDVLKEAGGLDIPIVHDDGSEDKIFGHVTTPDGQGDVMLTDGFIRHLIDHHESQTREEFANLILPSLRNPAEVWLQPHRVESRIAYRRAFVTAFEGRDTVTVAQENRLGSLSWTFFPVTRINRYRTGYLLYRRPRGR